LDNHHEDYHVRETPKYIPIVGTEMVCQRKGCDELGYFDSGKHTMCYEHHREYIENGKPIMTYLWKAKSK
jgi:hypothetical protein